MPTKHICVVTPCYNEEENVRELYIAIKAVFDQLPQYTYDHLYIDNASKDGTARILRELAAEDKRVKVILNTRNFGHIRSPYYGLLQSTGDATIIMASDFQDPPNLIPEFLRRWEAGSKLVLGVKETSSESPLMFAVRKSYYKLINLLASDLDLISNATGFGLYDEIVIKTLRTIDDPYPYTRGLLADIGFEISKVIFHQPARQRGITKNNFYTLYDMAMLGITNHSKIPLRIATMVGFIMSGLGFLLAMGYLIAKLLFWDFFKQGYAPILIGVFFFSSVQLFFIGLLGEYIGAIHTQVQDRPLVIEKERINFEEPEPHNSPNFKGTARRDGVLAASREELETAGKTP